VLAGITASTARAADVNVNPFRCDVFQGGQLTVDAGSTITIRQGVAEQTFGILRAYLNAQTTTITVNGTTVDVSGEFGAPEGPSVGKWGWTSWVNHPTGITLAAGESMNVVWTTTLAHPVPEVFNPAAGGQPGQPVSNHGTVTYSCTVTAV
jgi:hypothetical protein